MTSLHPRRPGDPQFRPGREAVVAVTRGDAPFDLLDEVAELAGFWDHLEAKLEASGVPREEFAIAIKINLMLLLNPRVPEVATDPKLVEHLVDRLRARGFRSIAVVESQNTGNNWLRNREVANVAWVAGYRPEEHGYELVDLTLEMERHTYTLPGYLDWTNYVGPTWRDADYRIDFCKFKTQLDNYYTLSSKNQFGCLPVQNKYWHYHTIIPYWAVTVYGLANFPVDFCFVDAYIGSDGAVGFAVQYWPKKVGRMMAGSDPMAVDQVGAKMMGLDPHDASIYRFSAQRFGEPEVELRGAPHALEPVEGWENVPEFIQNMGDIGQSIYMLANVGAISAATNLDTEAFPPKLFLMRYWFAFWGFFLLLFYGKSLDRHDRELYRLTTEREAAHRKHMCPGRPQ